MSNKYRVHSTPAGWPDTLPFKLSFPSGDYGVGDVFEHEFDSPQDEQANIDSGLIEVVPRVYKVVGDSTVHDTTPGETFEAALTMTQETALVAGGHIARVPEPKPEEPKKAPARKKKEEAK